MSTPAKPPDGQNDVYWLIGLAVAAVVALGYFTGNGPAGSFKPEPARWTGPPITAPNQYRSTVPPPLGDIDCADVGGPTIVGDYDPYYLDADNDGIGCEAGG